MSICTSMHGNILKITTNLSCKFFYLHLIQIQLHTSIHDFPSSCYKFDYNRRYLLRHTDVLKFENEIRNVPFPTPKLLLSQMREIISPLLHVFPSVPNTNPSSQLHVCLSLFLLQIWLQPPLLAVSHGCTKRRM